MTLPSYCSLTPEFLMEPSKKPCDRDSPPPPCREQEALTEQAKERAVRAEKELEDVRSQLSMAEAELRQLRASKEPSKPAKTRKTSTVSRKVSRPGLTTPQTPSRSESRRKL